MPVIKPVRSLNGYWLGRRAFLYQSGLLLAGSAALRPEHLAAASGQTANTPILRAGLVTDLHYADKPAAQSRHYRDSLAKLEEALRQFEQDKAEALFVLGDVIDSADTREKEKGFLGKVADKLRTRPATKAFVLGNHCVSGLTKPEFLNTVQQQESFFSFDLQGWHFAVLDACFRKDGVPYGRNNFEWTDANIPSTELEWLAGDLRNADRKSIVLVHQRLDAKPPYGVGNAEQVRQTLEASGKVVLVLQGHYHPGAYQNIAGIHYATLSALVEGTAPDNNAYAVLEVLPEDVLHIRGFKRQRSFAWS